jgi:hypothetical protein
VSERLPSCDGHAADLSVDLAQGAPTRSGPAAPDPRRRGAARARREDFRYAVREFLDEFALRGDDRSRAEAIGERPESTGAPRHDAYLGALAERGLAAVHRLGRPPWSVAPERFLDSFWFVSDNKGFRAVSIAQAPAAFRRRGIFVPERSLHRV